MSDVTEVRPMRPPDLGAVVVIHLSAFPGFFLSFLGARFLALFYEESRSLGEIVLVAERQGAVIGFVMGTCNPGGFFKKLIRRRLLAFGVAAAPAVLRRPSTAIRVARALLKPKQAAKAVGTATLLSLGVDPLVHGGGSGRLLVRAFLAEAGQRGSSKVDLTTDRDGNERTNRFYKHLGFAIAREIITPEARVLNEYEIELPIRQARV